MCACVYALRGASGRNPKSKKKEGFTMRKEITKKEAARQIMDIANAYEPRKLAFATVYRRIYRLPNGNWHMIGRAHDYTV